MRKKELSIIQQDFSTQNSKTRRITAAAISTTVWLIGLIFLKWNINETRVLFMVDMLLFNFFGVLRTIVSMDGDKSFFTTLYVRLPFGIITGFITSLLIMGISEMQILDKDLWLSIFHSPDRWTYGLILINYSGFFAHDFIYTGKYKTSNGLIEGFADFVSVLIMTLVLALVLTFCAYDAKQNPIYWLFSISGIVVGRFFMEIFLSMKAKIFLEDKPETS